MLQKIGFHSGPAGNKTGIGDYFKALDTAGIPVFFKSADDYGPLFELVNLMKASGNLHYPIYRMSTAGQNDGNDYDVPNYNAPPAVAALDHWNMTVAKLPPEFDRVFCWVEVTNELDKNRADWIGKFSKAIAIIATSQGYKICVPGWSSGEPETEQWETGGQLEFLSFAAANSDRVAIAIHEYSFDVSNIRRQYGDLVGRFTRMHDVCDGRGIPRPTVFITEWGWELDAVPEPGIAKAHIADIAAVYGKHPNIKGAAIWTLGAYQGTQIPNLTQKLIQPVKDLALEWGPDDLPPPDPPPPDPTPQPDIQMSSFEDGWQTLSSRLQQPDGFTLKVIAPGAPLWYPGGNGVVTGTVEAKHLKCLDHLPANQCRDGSDPLILDGDWSFKIQAVAMASGTSLARTYEGTGRQRVTVPVNVHWQIDTPNETNDVYVVLLLNGVEAARLQHPELKDRKWMLLTGEADGPVTAELRFQTTYANSRDLFTDKWIIEEIDTMPTLNEQLWTISVDEQIARGIPLNPEAALQKAIFAEGQTPVHRERTPTIDGVRYAVQAGESVDGSKPRRVYVWQPGKPVWFFTDPAAGGAPTDPPF